MQFWAPTSAAVQITSPLSYFFPGVPSLPCPELSCCFSPVQMPMQKNKEQGRDKKGEYILTDMKSEVIQIGTWKDAHWT